MREYLTLSTKEQQRSEVVGRWLAGILTTAEAVALLGCSERTAWRLRASMLREGAAGLAHGNRGRPSARRLPDAVADRIVRLATTTYRGFNDTHLAEALSEEEGIVLARSSLRRLLRSRGIPSPRRRRAPRYRSRRERMAQEGLMVQVDGSRHDWLEGRGPWLTLVGGIDDATGVIVGAVFREAEDSVGYLLMLRQMTRRHGLPASIYRDGSGVFASTRGTEQQRDEATQVGRALAELGITSIPAGSAQAKGRIERAWGTSQDRLSSELRRLDVTDLAGANEVLAAFVPRFNRRFAVPAASPVSAWRPVAAGLDLGPRPRLPLAPGGRLGQHHPAPWGPAPAPGRHGWPIAGGPAGRGGAPARRTAARPRRRATAGRGPRPARAASAPRGASPRPQRATRRCR